MGIDITLQQKGLRKKNIDLTLLKKVAANLEIATSDGTFRIQEYDNEPLDTIALLIYDPDILSRGFTLEVSKNHHDCFLRQTYFCSDNDIRQFFSFLKRLAKQLNITQYDKDGEILQVSDIMERTEFEIAFNRRTLHEVFKEEKYPDTIYAVKNPISIGPVVKEAILQMSEEDAMNYWTSYLHDLQDEDYYYAMPSFFQNKEGEIFGGYALTEDCFSVFPKQPYVPFGYDLKAEDISYYLLTIVSYPQETEPIRMPYEELWNYFPLDSLSEYDNKHVFLHLNTELLDRIRKDQQ